MIEREIIRKCQEYDKSGFKELVNVYSPILMSVCMRYLGDRQSAEDMVQESFIKIFRNILSYQEKGSFKSWVCKIAANTCLQEIRKRKSSIQIECELSEYSEELSVECPVIDDVEIIINVINELKFPYGVIFNLFAIEGYNHQEIAKMLDITESTSRATLSRARKMIQELLLKYKVQLIA